MPGEWQVISEHDINDKYTINGDFIRAYCHLHGSDHQRSLSINTKTGFGHCHSCGNRVVVREFNPEAAINIERGQERISAGEIRVIDPRYMTRPTQPKTPTVKAWKQDEINILRSLQNRMHARLDDERARTYIEGRGLSIETAQRLGLGYIPEGQYTFPLNRWSDHIVIPVSSPDGLQFAGRNLKLWQPGMDENEHKDILKAKEKLLLDRAEEKRKQGHESEAKKLTWEAKVYERYIKTHAGGWFNYQVLEAVTRIIVVEGAFDALALIEAGIEHTIAIIGTALDVKWLPKRLRHVTLAFDGDDSGREKSAAAHDTLYEQGYDVTICHAQDDMGKDWNERYRLHGSDALAVLRQDDDLYCVICSAEVEYYSPDGAPYCSKHWQVA